MNSAIALFRMSDLLIGTYRLIGQSAQQRGQVLPRQESCPPADALGVKLALWQSFECLCGHTDTPTNAQQERATNDCIVTASNIARRSASSISAYATVV
jgi:hypothetical protein